MWRKFAISTISLLVVGVLIQQHVCAQFAQKNDKVFSSFGLLPIVTYGYNSVGADNAIVTGNINSHNLKTTVSFDYGTTIDYGNTIESQESLTDSTKNWVGTVITGLNPGTTYHYRIVASNVNGTTYGRDTDITTLTTSSEPAKPKINIEVHSTYISFSSNFNNGNLATNAKLEYGITNNYGKTVKYDYNTIYSYNAINAEFAYINDTIFELVPGTTYHCRLTASNAKGEVFGDDVSFTTLTDGEESALILNELEKKIVSCNSAWEYQVQSNLNADVFAGYTMHPGNFGAISTNDNYNFNSFKWNDYIFKTPQAALLQLAKLKGTKYTDLYSIGLILKILTIIPIVDAFGPFPYFQFGSMNPVFDNVDVIYKQGFIAELNNAIVTLEAYKEENHMTNYTNDLTNFKGDYVKYIQLANTLKLRCAIRMSYADSTTAKALVAEVLNDPIVKSEGLLTSDLFINTKLHNLINPFFYICREWDDCVMGADIQSFLNGYSDPRENAYFSPNTDVSGTIPQDIFAGVRPGISQNTTKEKLYIKFSALKAALDSNIRLVSGAESYFLMAEVASRNIANTSKTAQQYYIEGVKASFTMCGLTEDQANTYLSSTNTPADYVDYVNTENSYKATTTVSPAWGVGGSDLEHIITQKWIAIFPLGTESWAEFRRTGFPKLKIPKNMESNANIDGTIPAGQFLQRLPYPPIMIQLGAVDAISNYLNGKDNGNTKIWWEVSLNVTEIKRAKGEFLDCSVYPNPATSSLIFKVENYNKSKFICQLCDMNGKLILNKDITGDETSISMVNLLPSTYFLKVSENNIQVKTFKIIKSKQ